MTTLSHPSVSRSLEQDRRAGYWPAIDVAIDLLRRRSRWIVVCILAVGGVASARAVMTPKTYTSTSAFVTESQRQGSSLAGVAAQFGLSVNGTDAVNTPMFYPELIKSPQFLRAVADSRVGDSANAQPQLLDLLERDKSRDVRARRESAATALAAMVDVSAGARTGIVTMSVTAGDPDLARMIGEAVLHQLDVFNNSRRQRRAGAERSFVERRLAEVAADLHGAEARLEGFMQENHDIRSAGLMMDQDRLRRDVALQQALYTSMRQSLEQAKIEETRDTPLITVIGAPDTPVVPNPRGRIRSILSGLAAGFALGVLIAFIVDVLSLSSADPRELA